MSKKAFWVLLIAAFSSMLGLGIISPFLPGFAEEHGANGFWLGMIFAGFGFSRTIIMPVVGKLFDKSRGKIIVTSGLVLYAVVSLFYPLADSVFSLIVVRVVHGFAAGMITPIVMAYVGIYTEKGKEAVTTGALNMMFYLGLAAGPFFGGILNFFFGFDSVFYVMAGLGIITFLMVLFFIPNRIEPLLTEGDAENKERIRPFKSLIQSNFIKAILIITALITFMIVSFLALVPSLAIIKHIDAVHIGIIISIGIFLGGVLQIPLGKFADQRDTSGKLIIIGIGTSIGMLSLLAMPFCPGFKALLIAGIFMGIGAGLSAPALSGIAVVIGKTAGMGNWMGIFFCVKSLSFVFTPIIAGIIMDFVGIDATFYTLAILGFFGGWAFVHYLRKKN